VETPPAPDPSPGSGNPGPPPKETLAPSRLHADIPESEFPIEIGIERAKPIYDRGGILVVDAREHDEFTEGHISGAHSAPYDEHAGNVEWLDSTAADPRPILVYCGGGDCELSLNLAFELTQSGHRRVMVLKDGFPAWKEAGYPVEQGEMP
jgi:rhodanese-related sulfurtransferase